MPIVDRAVISAATPGSLGLTELVRMYRQMLLIRYFEEEVQRLFTRNLVRGSTHLGIGQEAVSVGACDVLTERDTATATYRGHAAALAMGSPPEAAFAEILGRSTGLCGGKGGSMHLADLPRGFLGSFAIVGANLPVTVGAAWAAQHTGDGGISLAFFGDGSTNIGGFHEAMNLAGVWQLPVVFVCENNLYGEYSPLRSTTPIDRLADRAAGYGMPGVRVDGNDVEAVRAVVADAAATAREGGGPTFVEALTYRQCGHSRSDPAAYRPEGELARWIQRDPLNVTAASLASRGVSEEDLAAVRVDCENEIVAASQRAVAAPAPDTSVLGDDVWMPA